MLQFCFFVPAFLPFCCLLTVAETGQAKIYSSATQRGRNDKQTAQGLPACLPTLQWQDKPLPWAETSGIFTYDTFNHAFNMFDHLASNDKNSCEK
jgi:hypothetical protein